MPRISKEIREQIRNLSQKELVEIAIKAASKEKSVYDLIMVNYLNKESGEEELFRQAKRDISNLFFKGYKGFSDELRLANMIAACIKRLNEFTKISTNKVMEADLLVYILDEIPFSCPETMLGTCFTNYDNKVGMVVKRLITVVTKKLHKDYKIEYQDKINKYLEVLHRRSNHLDFIYDMPTKI